MMFKPTDLIPVQYRMIFCVSLSIAVVLMIGYAGAKVQEWRLTANFANERLQHSTVIAEMVDRLNEKIKLINDQNHAIEMVTVKTEMAEKAREDAEKRAESVLSSGLSRTKKIESIKATTCENVLNSYWEIRQ